MTCRHHSFDARPFQGGLAEAFLAGYHSATALVKEETARPDSLKLTIRELEVMLRRQCQTQLLRWTER